MTLRQIKKSILLDSNIDTKMITDFLVKSWDSSLEADPTLLIDRKRMFKRFIKSVTKSISLINKKNKIIKSFLIYERLAAKRMMWYFHIKKNNRMALACGLHLEMINRLTKVYFQKYRIYSPGDEVVGYTSDKGFIPGTIVRKVISREGYLNNYYIIKFNNGIIRKVSAYNIYVEEDYKLLEIINLRKNIHPETIVEESMINDSNFIFDFDEEVINYKGRDYDPRETYQHFLERIRRKNKEGRDNL